MRVDEASFHLTVYIAGVFISKDDEVWLYLTCVAKKLKIVITYYYFQFSDAEFWIGLPKRVVNLWSNLNLVQLYSSNRYTTTHRYCQHKFSIWRPIQTWSPPNSVPANGSKLKYREDILHGTLSEHGEQTTPTVGRGVSVYIYVVSSSSARACLFRHLIPE